MQKRVHTGMELPFLINSHLSEQLQATLLALHEKEPIQFVVVSDVNEQDQYQPSALVATENSLFTMDLVTEVCSPALAFADYSFSIKRLYGICLLRARDGADQVQDVFRFTFTIAGLCDSVVAYLNARKNGTAHEEAMEGIHAAYHKLLSVCPKCGRTLTSPGAACIGCMKKGRLVRRLGAYLKPQAPWLVLSVFLSIVTTCAALVPPFLTKSLVDEILPNHDRQALLFVVILLLSIHVFRHLVSGISGYILRFAGDKIMASIRCDVYRRAQYLPMQFYDKASTGSVINRISSDTAVLQSFMLRVTQDVVVQFFKLVGIITVMMVMNPKLTLLSLLPIPLIAIGSRIFRLKILDYHRLLWRRGSLVTSALTDTIPGIRVIKAFTHEKASAKRFEKVVGEWRVDSTRTGKVLNIYSSVVNCLVACGTVVIWGFGGNLVIDAILTQNATGLTVGLLVSFISYASMFYEPVNFFANFSDTVQSAMTSAERIMDILDAEPEHDFGKGNTAPDMSGRIEFKNVNFSFDRSKKVLKDINLTIEPGDIVGIVGTTGSGKSTLVNLLLRYYDHYDGEISIDGTDIRNIDLEYYRSSIGYVQQEPLMFNDTIYNNITYGDKEYTVDQVIEAADIANAHGFIARQPDGYESLLGERGVGLSGGERQRVSIARAMLRTPKLLIFDEATASVDSETEHLIQEAIDRLISGRTTIMIAHRLSTLAKANKIVVVDNGTIIECGTPEELLAQKGKYYRLVEIQNMADQVAMIRKSERL